MKIDLISPIDLIELRQFEKDLRTGQHGVYHTKGTYEFWEIRKILSQKVDTIVD